MTELTRETMDALARPFDPDRVEWKPQATAGDRALALAYADSRTYMDRLDDVVGPDWSDTYTVLADGAVVKCELTVKGVTRTGIGEADPSDRNTATSAASQSFKRAAVKFGVGRYLYDLPETWADFDPQRKVFTPSARRKLRASLEGGEVSGTNGPDTPEHRPDNGRGGNGHGPTAFWSLWHKHGKDIVGRGKAERWAESGDWEAAMDKLREALE